MDEGSGNLDSVKSERSVWLMKCPLVVAKSWQAQSQSSSSTAADSHPAAKVVVSVDPLRSEDPSSLQVAALLVPSHVVRVRERENFF